MKVSIYREDGLANTKKIDNREERRKNVSAEPTI